MLDTMLISDPRQAGMLIQPVKVAILESLVEPATTAELAGRLSQTRQRLGYHVRQLEQAGLIEVVAETRVRNCVGRRMQSIARRFLLAPDTGQASPGELSDVDERFSSSRLVENSARTISEVTRLLQASQDIEGDIPTLCLDGLVSFDSPGDRRAFAQELTELLGALASRYGSEGPAATPFRLQAACYPQPE